MQIEKVCQGMHWHKCLHLAAFILHTSKHVLVLHFRPQRPVIISQHRNLGCCAEAAAPEKPPQSEH